MGYWHGWTNFHEWAIMNDYTKKCLYCGEEFYPSSPNQKYCTYEINPICVHERYFEKLWERGKHPLQLNGQYEKAVEQGIL